MALALLFFPLGAVAQAPSGASPEISPPIVGIQVVSETAAEGGDPAFLRISRDPAGGDLEVRLTLEGDAEIGKDYTIQPMDESSEPEVSVTLGDGEQFIELKVEAVDDVPAEADETIILTLQESEAYGVDAAARSAAVTIPGNDFAVTTTQDGGEGSLRQAILNAIDLDGPNTVTFDSKVGPFSTPQTIVLESDLPDLGTELTIDGRIEGGLWKAVGVTVSGGGERRVFNVKPGGRVTLHALTVADGRAKNGGGVANTGELVVKGVTFTRNVARRRGGGLFNKGGELTVINSTFSENRARRGGGGLANKRGTVTVTNCTFSDNTAKKGAGLYSTGSLLLRNTILANSDGRSDCKAKGSLDPASTHNLIESSDGCGEPFISSNPNLTELGSYNGPAHTMPLGTGSPAINMGDNASALDENGAALVWDQRGNGDPRFVAGYTDIGAVETQAWPWLQVDTLEDVEVRSCTRAAKGDCSLRGAIQLANAMKRSDVITFDPVVFAEPRTLTLSAPLPDLAAAMTLDAGEAAEVRLVAAGAFPVVNILPGIDVKFENVVWDELGPPLGETE